MTSITIDMTSQPVFACPHEAYASWLNDKDKHTIEVVRSIDTDEVMMSMESREMFQRLKAHFELFGFLTHATFEGFFQNVLKPAAIILAVDRPDPQ